ncbi:hypothetical protein [uncultured Amnibacterium sp.]|uniref:hypothetical protein n=1 Tax=uncultured Amnibacterium sp. TaxID=1631851 RepID=UPI0035CC1B77
MTLTDRIHAPWDAGRLAAREGLNSSEAVAKTHRLDGRTALVAVRDRNGWRRVRRVRWTSRVIVDLRAQRVQEVVIRRGIRTGRLPLAWLPRSAGA